MKVNRLILYAMILVLFFEAYAFSVTILGVRIRLGLALSCLAVLVVLVGWLCRGWRLPKTGFDFFLWGYLGVNALAILKSQDLQRGIKITALLLVLILLFYVFLFLLFKKEIFSRAFRLFLWTGVVEITYGLYQVAAGMIRFLAHVNLPIGTSGLAQADYIGAPWGRPYGTLVEADWFAAICMFYALVFMTLTFSQNPPRRFFRAGLLLSLAALFFSFVRGAWLGFLFGLVLLLILQKRIPGLRLKPAKIIKAAAVFLLVLLLATAFFPPVRQVFQKRFFPDPGHERRYTLEIRWVAMKESFRSFLESPLLGHGPGVVGPTMGFNPSLLTTLLDDTGLAGLTVFAIFLFLFFRQAARRIPELDDQDQLVSLGIFVGLGGLFVSYLITCGLWMPFTWVFMAFGFASLRKDRISRM